MASMKRLALACALALVFGCADDGADGAPGADGMDGASALVETTALGEGDADCPAGGTRIDAGLDDGDGDGTAGNGALEDGEIDSTATVCNGTGGGAAATLVATAELPLGDADCPAGGVRVDVGLDDGDGEGTAGNGELEAGEVDSSSVVCSGLEGAGSGGLRVDTRDGVERNVRPDPQAEHTLLIDFVGRYTTGVFDESAAEIVAWDPETERAFVVNANAGNVSVIDFSTPSAPTLVDTLDAAGDITAEGAAGGRTPGEVNSVSLRRAGSGSVIALAVAADPVTDAGWVAFYAAEDGSFLSAVDVGALPDMVTYTPNGQRVLVANEGEPDDGVDPEGTVSIVDVRGGEAGVTNADVTTVGFGEFDAGEARAGELPAEVIIAPEDASASVSQDLEPEYVAVSPDSSTAWVTLQENNAVAIVDVEAGTITAIAALGFKDHALPGNELDASDRDGLVNIRSWPVLGMYMPDSIAAYEVGGQVYLLTANEGDARDFSEARAEDIADPDELGATFTPADGSFGSASELLERARLGRLEIHTQLGVTDRACLGDGDLSDCVYDRLYAYGARSFSVWNGSTGELVWDSGHAFEVITASALGGEFNANNDENGGDSRSDAKGPEPEAITVGQIADRWFAFIGLERMGGIVVYDVSDPAAPSFVTYYLERDFAIEDVEAAVEAEEGVDLGPESIVFVPAEDSPVPDTPVLLVGHEVSGTTTMLSLAYQRIPRL